jgi:hypothetical protein
MKTIILFITSMLFSVSASSGDLEVVEGFAAELIDIVKNSDVTRFKEIGCVKISCGNIGIGYIFGDNDSSHYFKEIMSKKDITFKVFGPYTIEKEYVDSSYGIVFYSKSNSPFGPNGTIDPDVGYAQLYRTFLQTQVTVVAGKVLFQRVPFYLESHHPYVGDYG